MSYNSFQLINLNNFNKYRITKVLLEIDFSNFIQYLIK